NVTAIDDAGSLDLCKVRKESCQWSANATHLALTAFRSRTHQDCGLGCKNGSIFNECGIRIIGVRLQQVGFDSTSFESNTVGLILLDNFGKIGRAQRGRSQPAGEISGWLAKNCVLEHSFHRFHQVSALSRE